MTGGAIREPSIDERLEVAHVSALLLLGAVPHGRLIDVTKVPARELPRVRRFVSDLLVVRSRLGR